MTDKMYGPDKPCRRTPCIAAHQLAVQDSRARQVEAGADPVDVAADPLPETGDHVGGVHLDPADRAHYDGLRATAMPEPIRRATQPLMRHVSAYDRPRPDDSDLRVAVDVALDAAFREIDRLRQQVAHVQVDADHKVRDALRRADDCTEHGAMIQQLEGQVGHFDKAQMRAERGRLALLGFLHAVDEFLDARRKAQAAGAQHDVRADEIANALAAAAKKTHAAHARAWKD